MCAAMTCWESFRTAKFRDKLGISLSALLMVSCVYTFVRSPTIMCIVDKCNNITYQVLIVFPQIVSTVCIVARITFTCKSTSDKFADYEERIGRYELGLPPDGVRGRRFRHVCTAMFAAVCASLLIPPNAYRLYLFYGHHGNREVIVYFLLMYTQNAVGCLSEILFLPYCIELYQHFRLINEEISAIKSASIVTNGYPSVLESDVYRPRPAGNNAVGTAASGDGVPLARRRPKQRAVAGNIETLKTRHRFVSDMIAELNELYGIQLGVNLFGLFIMMLFDIFEAIAIEDSGHPTKNMFLIYSWLAQYTVRFCVIVLTVHATTSQALHSKTLVTDINHRYMDINTKEEVRLFLNELCTRSMQFTTLDSFNLNARLITSAIVAGTTYVVVLLQFRGR